MIVVTASVADQDIRERRAACMTAHIPKPVEPVALHATLAQVLAATTKAAVAAA